MTENFPKLMWDTKPQNQEMYSIMYEYVKVCVCVYVWLCISERNCIYDTRNRREKSRLFCHYKVFTIPIKWYSIIWNWTWISYECVLQNLGQPQKKKSATNMLKKEWKLNHVNCLTWRTVEDKNRNRNNK